VVAMSRGMRSQDTRYGPPMLGAGARSNGTQQGIR